MASPINSVLGLNRSVKEYQGLNECYRIDELKGGKIGAAFPSAAFGKCDHVSQAPPIVKRTVTVTLNDAADCSSFSLTAGCHFDETCESDGEADEDDILRSFEETVLLSSNDLAAVIRLRFVLYHEGRLVATYRCLRVGSKLCLMAPKTEDCSGSALACLFDYASSHLDTEAVVLCLPRQTMDKGSIRSFMFLGFETLPPQHDLCEGLNSPFFFFMAYHM